MVVDERGLECLECGGGVGLALDEPLGDVVGVMRGASNRCRKREMMAGIGVQSHAPPYTHGHPHFFSLTIYCQIEAKLSTNSLRIGVFVLGSSSLRSRTTLSCGGGDHLLLQTLILLASKTTRQPQSTVALSSRLPSPSRWPVLLGAMASPSYPHLAVLCTVALLASVGKSGAANPFPTKWKLAPLAPLSDDKRGTLGMAVDRG